MRCECGEKVSRRMSGRSEDEGRRVPYDVSGGRRPPRTWETKEEGQITGSVPGCSPVVPGCSVPGCSVVPGCFLSPFVRPRLFDHPSHGGTGFM